MGGAAACAAGAGPAARRRLAAAGPAPSEGGRALRGVAGAERHAGMAAMAAPCPASAGQEEEEAAEEEAASLRDLKSGAMPIESRPRSRSCSRRMARECPPKVMELTNCTSAERGVQLPDPEKAAGPQELRACETKERSFKRPEGAERARKGRRCEAAHGAEKNIAYRRLAVRRKALSRRPRAD